MAKERLDVLLVNRGLAPSREKAKALIMAGEVFVGGQREDKAGAAFREDVFLEVKSHALKYVGRGGFKLEKALELWKPNLQGVVCMDVGASTGGFTDCMLQNGAKKVYAVDVGTNQLAWKLRQDERVVVREKTNIRYLTWEELGEKVGFVTVDVSFISLGKVLLPIRGMMKDESPIVCLVKPQFEAGRERVGKKGVVREQGVHREVLEGVAGYAGEVGFRVRALEYSPIKGPEGNIEYLLLMEKRDRDKGSDKGFDVCEAAKETVARAHVELAKSG